MLRDGSTILLKHTRLLGLFLEAISDNLLDLLRAREGGRPACRPDRVGFANGLPLLVIELKKPGVPARAAFDGNLTHCRERIDNAL
jgi:type I restriction enzyme R subunit